MLSVTLVAVGVAVSGQGSATSQAPPATAPRASVDTEDEARIVCGTACHAFPTPDILPRFAWRDEIARMALIRDNNPEPRGPRGMAGRMMVLPPDMERVLRYYLANAPEALPVPLTWPAAVHDRVRQARADPVRRTNGPRGGQRASARRRRRRQARARSPPTCDTAWCCWDGRTRPATPST